MKFSKNERNWILYDVGNSAFTMLIATIIPIYFNSLAEQAGLSSVQYLAYWGYIASIVTVLVAFMGPILGTLADTKGWKKKLFQISIGVGAVCCSVLGLMQNWLVFLVVFAASKFFYSCSLIFYDAMLADVTDEERMDHVSSSGYAWGYIGSCIPFIISIALVLGHEAVHMSMTMAMEIAFLINAIWWVAMSCPLFKSYKQTFYMEKQENVVKESFGRLWNTLKSLHKEKKAFWFLIAFFFYIDGVYTIIDMATAYGSALGLNSTGLLLALLVTQIVAFPSTIAFGKLSEKIQTHYLIMISIVCYIGIVIYAVFMTKQYQFWVLAVCVGLFQGGVQALSRSYYAKIIPPQQSGEFFGLYDICGKGAAFVGTTLVGVVAQLTGNLSYGVGTIAILFVFGFFTFMKTVRISE